MPLSEVDLNSEALAKAIRFVGRKSLLFGGFVLGVTIIIGLISGSAAASQNGTPGWGSVFFMYGGIQSLAVAIPVALCLYIGVTLFSGTIGFLYYRFSGNQKSNGLVEQNPTGPHSGAADERRSTEK